MSEDNNNTKEGGSISSLFINRPVMTVLLSVAAAFFGIFCYKQMPVNDLPGVDYPVIQVSVNYPGADPTIMGANIASPLEQQSMQNPGIERITSRNRMGATSIVLQFALSKNIDAAATDVQSAIQRAMGNLPADLPSPPSFTKDNPNDMPIYIISLMSDGMTVGELYDSAYSHVAQQLNMVEGVSKVDVYAAPRAVRIEVDTKKLYNLGYTMANLAAALSRSTNMTGTGSVNGPTTQYVLFPDTQLSTAAPAPRKAGLVFCSLFAPCALPRPAGGTARGVFCFADFAERSTSHEFTQTKQCGRALLLDEARGTGRTATAL